MMDTLTTEQLADLEPDIRADVLKTRHFRQGMRAAVIAIRVLVDQGTSYAEAVEIMTFEDPLRPSECAYCQADHPADPDPSA